MFRSRFFSSSIHNTTTTTTTSIFCCCNIHHHHQKRFQSSSSPSSTTTEQLQLARVVSTAKKLTAYMNLHKSSVNLPKRRIALQAWREIEELPQRYLQVADIDSVVKMLQVVSYFSTCGEWENGHEGPANPIATKEAKKLDKSLPARDAEEIDIPAEFLYVAATSTAGNSGSKMVFQEKHNNARQQNLRGFSYANNNSNNRSSSSSSARNSENNKSASSGGGDVIGDMIE